MDGGGGQQHAGRQDRGRPSNKEGSRGDRPPIASSGSGFASSSGGVAGQWREAFVEVAAALGFAMPPGIEPDVSAVLETARALRTAEKGLQDELSASRRREAALQLQLSSSTLENIELRREAAAAWAAAEPAVLQVRQLHTDPAIGREFARLREELEQRTRQVRQQREELEGLTFTQESKVNLALVEKCRKLLAENEEMGAALIEGAGSGTGGQATSNAEAQLALARSYAQDLRASFQELRDHAALLEAENEELATAVWAARRAVMTEGGAVAGGQGAPWGGGRGRGGGGGAGAGGGGYGRPGPGPGMMHGGRGGHGGFRGQKRMRQ